MMALEYHGGDSLLVPVERADLIQKYASGEADVAPTLDRLGGGTWKRRKARVRKAVREMAAELLRLAAVRHAAEGFAFSPDSPWQREFEDAFEFELTMDQERSVTDIKNDMESTRPMDRLLCGDVGYGKTEVAIRAAFKAVLEGKQVAVLAPTTILAEQHLETFRRRFAGFPVETRMLSRFSTPAEAKDTIKGLAEGTVDVVVGTHRLLGESVIFRDLGLVVDGRGAAFRRRPEGAAQAAAGGGRRARHVGDADPAHPQPLAQRSARHLDHRDPAPGPAGGGDQRPPVLGGHRSRGDPVRDGARRPGLFRPQSR